MRRLSRFVVLTFALGHVSMLSAQQETMFSLPRTEVVDIHDPVGDRVYQLYIQLPAGYYRQDGSSGYPAIYITDATYNFPMVEGFVRVASNDGAIENVILVGISSERGKSFRESRILDYTPAVDDEWLNPTGGAAAFLDFVRNEVFGYVESNYFADPENRTYIGYSLGGLLGAYALLTEPTMFDNYILVSPSLYYREKYVLKLLESGEAKAPGAPTRVYLSAGEHETPEAAGIRNNLVTDAERFHRRLEAAGHPLLDARMQVVMDAVHSTAFPEPMARALHWMLKPTSTIPR